MNCNISHVGPFWWGNLKLCSHIPTQVIKRVRLNWIITPNLTTLQVCTFQWLPSAIVNSFEGPTHPINTHSPTTTPVAPSREHLHMLPRRNHNGLCQASTSWCPGGERQRVLMAWLYASYDVWLCKTVECMALSYCSTFLEDLNMSAVFFIGSRQHSSILDSNHSDEGWFSKSFAITFNHSPNKARWGIVVTSSFWSFFQNQGMCQRRHSTNRYRCAETVMNSSLLLMLAVVLGWLVARRLQREVGLQLAIASFCYCAVMVFICPSLILSWLQCP